MVTLEDDTASQLSAKCEDFQARTIQPKPEIAKQWTAVRSQLKTPLYLSLSLQQCELVLLVISGRNLLWP